LASPAPGSINPQYTCVKILVTHIADSSKLLPPSALSHHDEHWPRLVSWGEIQVTKVYTSMLRLYNFYRFSKTIHPRFWNQCCARCEGETFVFCTVIPMLFQSTRACSFFPIVNSWRHTGLLLDPPFRYSTFNMPRSHSHSTDSSFRDWNEHWSRCPCAPTWC
jgi:hypothetical protein